MGTGVCDTGVFTAQGTVHFQGLIHSGSWVHHKGTVLGGPCISSLAADMRCPVCQEDLGSDCPLSLLDTVYAVNFLPLTWSLWALRACHSELAVAEQEKKSWWVTKAIRKHRSVLVFQSQVSGSEDNFLSLHPK